MNRKIGSMIRSLKRTDFVWRYGFNFMPTIRRRIEGEVNLNLLQQSLVTRLNTHGIAITSVDELMGGDSVLQELDSEARFILETAKDEVDRLRSLANEKTDIGNKTFNLEVLGSELMFDASSIFARFALHKYLLEIANAYFRMYAKLRYYNVWKTFASNGAARESQLWHFDREDNYILKAFLYLEDVDQGSGPFTYAPGTHRKGKFRWIEPEYFLEGGVRRTTDMQMQKVFPENKWLRGNGKRGTLILADTRGFHKGGEARTKDRLMFTCMFTSPASESRQLIKFAPGEKFKDLNRMQRRALGFE